MAKTTIPPKPTASTEATAVRSDTPPGEPGHRLCLLISTATGVSIVPIERGMSYTLGRDTEADVLVDDKSVSRKHVRLDVGDRITLTDLGSSNGTKQNERRLADGEECMLHIGSSFELGSTTVVLQRAQGFLAEDGAPLVSRQRGAVKEGREPSGPNRIVHDAAMIRLYQLLRVVAPSPLNVLVLGETGVGKEIFAETIHAMSNRPNTPYVQLNCAAVPETLFEGELFGHDKGAFTGADRAKEGIFESADGGTVFLDEIGEVPLVVQAKLLRVLETGEVQRLGSVRPKRVNVRFISATNRDLRVLIMDQRFREDLYFRLNGISITLPPLRKRRDDILPLAEHFARRMAGQLHRAAPKIGEPAAAKLLEYHWPGNVRELRNVIDRAVVVSGDDPTIGPAHLQLSDHADAPQPDPRGLPLPELQAAPPGRASPLPPAEQRRSRGPVQRVSGVDLKAQVDEFERSLILDALEKSAGNQSKAARVLGISRRVLILRLEQYGVPRPRKEPPEERDEE